MFTHDDDKKENDTVQREIARLHKSADALAKKVKTLRGKTVIRCERSVLGAGCGEKLSICDLTYIRTHWYVNPHGCTGGDYWKEGEGQFVCPCCYNRNRLICEREWVEKMQYYFKDIVDVYGKEKERKAAENITIALKDAKIKHE